jgi:hypothetical protein
MGIFKNIFNCYSTKDDNEEDTKRITIELRLLQKEVTILFNDLKRLKDKTSNQFMIINNKIDNIILLINKLN